LGFIGAALRWHGGRKIPSEPETVKAAEKRKRMSEGGPPDGVVQRLYSVPFSRVWQAALALLGSGRGWTLTEADPQHGSLLAERGSMLRRRPQRFYLSITLDPLGLTRVEAAFVRGDGTPVRRGKGRAAERILRRLDRALGVNAPS
jgi:hypothetical protein